MPDKNPHFEAAASWEAAEALLTFPPRQPTETGGFELQSLRVHVRDHKMRALAMEERTLEAHYGEFVFTQSRPGLGEARRRVRDVSYGTAGYEVSVLGREGRAYEMGPEPEPDDIDPRLPAVVVWHDAEMFFLLASGTLAAQDLIRIATSVHA